MDELLGDDAVLMVPSAPGPAPILNTPLQKLNSYRASLISLTSIAGLAGLPQVRHFCHWLPSWRVPGESVPLNYCSSVGNCDPSCNRAHDAARCLPCECHWQSAGAHLPCFWDVNPRVNCVGLSWYVQVSLPVATVEGCPVGLGLIGPRGSDEELLRLTEQLLPILKPQ